MQLAARYGHLPHCFFKVEALEDEEEVAVVNFCTKAGHDDEESCVVARNKNKNKTTADQLTRREGKGRELTRGRL